MPETSEQDLLEYAKKYMADRHTSKMKKDESKEILTPESIVILLGLPDFQEKIAKSILKTDRIQAKGRHVAFGKEYGFTVYHDPTLISPGFRVGSLVVGGERSIHLGSSSRNFPEEIQQQLKSVLFFHTHPVNTFQLRDAMVASVKQGSKFDLDTLDQIPIHDDFSEKDLMILRDKAVRRGSSVIEALGTEELKSEGGNLLLISFGSSESVQSFNPREVAMRSWKYKRDGGDFLDAYKEAGLNAIMIPVNFSQPTLKQDDIIRASTVLTTRSK